MRVTSPVALGWFVESSPRSSRHAVAPAPGGEDDGRGVELVLAAGRAPAVLARLERAQRRVCEERAGAGLERVAERLRDRVAGAVADLEQALGGRAAAAGEAVAAVLARELDAELLEPVDRVARVAGEHLDEPHVGALVGAAPDVRRVLLGRVVLAERGLDPALRLGGVAGLDRALGREPDARARALCGHRCGEAGGAAADHEHVEGGRGHGARIPASIIRRISAAYQSTRRIVRLRLRICCKQTRRVRHRRLKTTDTGGATMSDQPNCEPTSTRLGVDGCCCRSSCYSPPRPSRLLLSPDAARADECDRPVRPSRPPARRRSGGGDRLDCGGGGAAAPTAAAATSTSAAARATAAAPRAVAPSSSTSTRTSRVSAGAFPPARPTGSAMRERPGVVDLGGRRLRGDALPARLVRRRRRTTRSRRAIRGAGRTSATTTSRRSSSSARSRTGTTTRATSETQASDAQNLTSMPASGCSRVGASVASQTSPGAGCGGSRPHQLLLERHRPSPSLWARELVGEIYPIPFPLTLIQGWRYAPVASSRGEAGYPSTVLRADGRSTSAASGTGASRASSRSSGSSFARTVWRSAPTSARTPGFACETSASA